MVVRCRHNNVGSMLRHPLNINCWSIKVFTKIVCFSWLRTVPIYSQCDSELIFLYSRRRQFSSDLYNNFEPKFSFLPNPISQAPTHPPSLPYLTFHAKSFSMATGVQGTNDDVFAFLVNFFLLQLGASLRQSHSRKPWSTQGTREFPWPLSFSLPLSSSSSKTSHTVNLCYQKFI